VLTHPTLDQLQQLGLPGMARAFTELEANPSSAELSHAEWLALLLDREATERYDRRLRARLRYLGCAIKPSSRTSTIALHAASIEPCSRASPAAPSAASWLPLLRRSD
jgi:DNA replication protein DnaC